MRRWLILRWLDEESWTPFCTTSIRERFEIYIKTTPAPTAGAALPVELVYGEEYDRVVDAYAREKQIQNWGRAKREALINGEVEALPPLAKKKFDKKKNIKKPLLVE